ncbi:hypothetical protein GIS00_09215 [Nakamurella sp. YIM 132087]|uniref:AlgX/AlgJ SGNH hydrolase-like domain-containing protein n=1 Tax=Nakamurella alba TaxID=2665158 RepID=A0A7K1FLM1_9ACTN|nr:hypothetical protein [Nakamurella alba]MTD14123.1 hypothetical protein [Nakamurella alba]
MTSPTPPEGPANSGPAAGQGAAAGAAADEAARRLRDDIDPVHHPRAHTGVQPVADPPEAQHSGRRRQTKIYIVPLVVAAVFFLGPAAAFVLGNRATEIDNRPLTKFPAVSAGWEFIPELQAWANDHLPLRAEAVKAGTKISEWLFKEPPNYGQRSDEIGPVPGGGGEVPGGGSSGGTTSTPGQINYPRVLQGKDGWLFVGGDVSEPCQPTMTPQESADALQRISDAVKASGRNFVLVVAPDKSAAEPEFMPDTFAGRDCMDTARDEFWAAADKLDGVTLVNPLPAVQEKEQSSGESAWRKLDTHWGPLGASVMGQQLADALDPTLLDNTTATVEGTVSLRGDLSALLGTPQTEDVPGVTLDRPGVQLSLDGAPITAAEAPTVGYSFQEIRGTTDGPATLYQPDTVIFGDSFLASSVPYVVPYFSSVSYINYNAAAQEGAITSMANRAVQADTVVLELVERNAVSGAAAILRPANVDALVAALEANPR